MFQAVGMPSGKAGKQGRAGGGGHRLAVAGLGWQLHCIPGQCEVLPYVEGAPEPDEWASRKTGGLHNKDFPAHSEKMAKLHAL